MTDWIGIAAGTLATFVAVFFGARLAVRQTQRQAHLDDLRRKVIEPIAARALDLRTEFRDDGYALVDKEVEVHFMGNDAKRLDLPEGSAILVQHAKVHWPDVVRWEKVTEDIFQLAREIYQLLGAIRRGTYNLSSRFPFKGPEHVWEEAQVQQWTDIAVGWDDAEKGSELDYHVRIPPKAEDEFPILRSSKSPKASSLVLFRVPYCESANKRTLNAIREAYIENLGGRTDFNAWVAKIRAEIARIDAELLDIADTLSGQTNPPSRASCKACPKRLGAKPRK